MDRVRYAARRARPATVAGIAALAMVLGGLAATGDAQAQAQVEISERPEGIEDPGVSCVALLIVDSQPALAEWTWWLGAAGGARDLGTAPALGWEQAIFAARLGGSVTFPLASMGAADRYGGPFHLRAGPYLLAETAFDGVLGEGGVELTFGQHHHAQWGTFGLRFGGGAAVDERTGTGHLSGTLFWGVMDVAARHSARGACADPVDRSANGFASGIRLFATVRGYTGDDRGATVIVGVEFEPSFFFPPYSWQKLLGVPPTPEFEPRDL